MAVLLKTTAVALHPDVLQPHPLTLAPPTMPELLEEDATPSLWLVMLFISFTLDLMLLILRKSGKPYVLALQSPLLCHCYCII